MTNQGKINAKEAKYIKLGEKGEWERLCIEEGDLRLGYYEVPHSIALAGDRDAIKDIYLQRGQSQTAASNHARQVFDFYHTEPTTLWVTFSDGYLWWCQAASNVEFIADAKERHPMGSRRRRTLSGWSNTSVTGEILAMSALSGRLTRVTAYRQTICSIKGAAFDYLLRKINGQPLPQVENAQIARKNLKRAAQELIRLLTWQDFELFTDLVFSQSGWQRISATGGAQKTIDLELIHPLTNEKAVVQVKSQTDQKQLNQYIESLSSYSGDRAFYVYHSSPTKLDAGASDISLMGLSTLTDCTLRSGLIDWLIEKTG